MNTMNARAPISAAGPMPVAGALPKSFVLLVMAWLFDFPAEAAGEGLSTQQYFAGIYIVSALLFVIGDRDDGRRVPGLMPTMVLGGLYLVIGIAVGFAEDQPAYSVLRNGLTVFVYLSAIYVTARVALMSNPTRLRWALGIACLLYTLANLAMDYLSSGGIDIATVRYQIVGVSVNAALAYVTLSLLFRLSRTEWLTMLANGVIVLVSVTRSYVLVAAFQLLTLAGLMRQSLSPRVIAIGAMGASALLVMLTLGQSQLLRWQDRLFGSGRLHTESWTWETRISEWTYMYDQWTGSLSQFFFGSGIAARTIYFLPSQLGGGAEFMIGFGHNQHLSMLFTGGILAGLPLLVLQFRHGLFGWRFVRQAIRFPHLRDDAVFLGAWGGLTVIGCLVVNTFDPIFSYRGDALWYGIGTGLLLGISARFDPANAARLPAPPPLKRSGPSAQ